MNKTHFDAYFDHMLNEVRETRDAGKKEYAHTEENVFANFDRIGKSINTIPDKVLMTYLLKHIDGINAYIKGHNSQREDVTGRIKDSIVYLFLLWAMIDGEKSMKNITNGKIDSYQKMETKNGVETVESML